MIINLYLLILSNSSTHICDDNNECNNKIIKCKEDEPCTVTCPTPQNGLTSKCKGLTVICPPDHHCEVHCLSTVKEGCMAMNITAIDSLSLLVNAAPGDRTTEQTNTMDDSFIYCPHNGVGPYNRSQIACRINCDGNDVLRKTQIFAVEGFNDVVIDATTYTAFWCYRKGTMHCKPDYSVSCTMNTDRFHEIDACDSTNDDTDNFCGTYKLPPTTEPTSDPTSSPSTSPTTTPTNTPTNTPTTTPTTTKPTDNPTNEPTDNPTITPTIDPTETTPTVTPVTSTTYPPLISTTPSPSTTTTTTTITTTPETSTTTETSTTSLSPTTSTSTSTSETSTTSETNTTSLSPTTSPFMFPNVTDIFSTIIIDLNTTDEEEEFVSPIGVDREPMFAVAVCAIIGTCCAFFICCYLFRYKRHEKKNRHSVDSKTSEENQLTAASSDDEYIKDNDTSGVMKKLTYGRTASSAEGFDAREKFRRLQTKDEEYRLEIIQKQEQQEMEEKRQKKLSLHLDDEKDDFAKRLEKFGKRQEKVMETQIIAKMEHNEDPDNAPDLLSFSSGVVNDDNLYGNRIIHDMDVNDDDNDDNDDERPIPTAHANSWRLRSNSLDSESLDIENKKGVNKQQQIPPINNSVQFISVPSASNGHDHSKHIITMEPHENI